MKIVFGYGEMNASFGIYNDKRANFEQTAAISVYNKHALSFLSSSQILFLSNDVNMNKIIAPATTLPLVNTSACMRRIR